MSFIKKNDDISIFAARVYGKSKEENLKKHKKTGKKKTVLIGVIGITMMIISMALSFNSAVIYNNYIPLIVFTTTCIYAELKEKYKINREKEDSNIE